MSVYESCVTGSGGNYILLVQPLEKFMAVDSARVTEMGGLGSRQGSNSVPVLSDFFSKQDFLFRSPVAMTVQLHINAVMCDFRSEMGGLGSRQGSNSVPVLSDFFSKQDFLFRSPVAMTVQLHINAVMCDF